MTDAVSTEEPPLIDPFLAQILERNSRDLAHITNALVDNLTDEVETLRATIDAIRDDVKTMFSGPYMPNPSAVLRALWPDEEAVDFHRQPKEN